MVVGRYQLLRGCWTGGLTYLLTVLRRPLTFSSLPCGSPHRQLTKWQLASLRPSKHEHPRWRTQPFCNLIPEVAAHCFCSILLIRSSSPEGITQGYEFRGPWGPSQRVPATEGCTGYLCESTWQGWMMECLQAPRISAFRLFYLNHGSFSFTIYV